MSTGTVHSVCRLLLNLQGALSCFHPYTGQFSSPWLLATAIDDRHVVRLSLVCHSLAYFFINMTYTIHFSALSIQIGYFVYIYVLMLSSYSVSSIESSTNMSLTSALKSRIVFKDHCVLITMYCVL